MRKRMFEYYCDDFENIENYKKAKTDNFKNWECHHRLETHNSDGERRLVDISHKELKALGMYYHRPAAELIFMTESEHNTLHHKGKKMSDEAKKKISKASKGKPKSEEHVKKVAEALRGKHLSEEHKKKLSENIKNSTKFQKVMQSEEHRKKMSECVKEMHWFNNGKINTRAKECPEGFIPGRIYHRK